MKILFLTTEHEDYLADSLFHGLRSILGDKVIDFPQKEFLYKGGNENLKAKYKIRGKAFTLYGLLNDIVIDRNKVYERFKNGEINVIIFSSIQRQSGLFLELAPFLSRKNTIILDGEDTPALYPYHGNFLRKFYYLFTPRPHKKFFYYKRELTPVTNYYRWYKILPQSLSKFIPLPSNVRRISFSIPEEKINNRTLNKTKLFPKHIVDEEVANRVNGSSSGYVFENEGEYYKDLQNSKFGITTKRAGWDCLRHYEIAANGSVICFKDLDKKPANCAPHGLNDSNCIIYNSYDDLMSKINSLSDDTYMKLQNNLRDWIYNNTTQKKAESLIKDFGGDL